jgi:uncharacterized protein (TIGR00255 family)
MMSMTGFGRGDARGDGVTWSVELSSVNRKQLELAISLPRELHELEAAIRSEIAQHCARGRIAVQVRSDTGEAGSADLLLDEALASRYAERLHRLAVIMDLPMDLRLADAARLPGLLELTRTTPQPDQAGPLILQALTAALRPFLAMRTAEGEHLRSDIAARLASITDLLSQISDQAHQVTGHYRKQLMQRLQDAGLPLDLTDDRLIKEVALFADRSDISEEISRAHSHLAQFQQQLAATTAMGRSLDFLTQELFREFNTMGSKANLASISHLVVAAKSEIEKAREQIQNVE